MITAAIGGIDLRPIGETTSRNVDRYHMTPIGIGVGDAALGANLQRSSIEMHQTAAIDERINAHGIHRR